MKRIKTFLRFFRPMMFRCVLIGHESRVIECGEHGRMELVCPVCRKVAVPFNNKGRNFMMAHEKMKAVPKIREWWKRA